MQIAPIHFSSKLCEVSFTLPRDFSYLKQRPLTILALNTQIRVTLRYHGWTLEILYQFLLALIGRISSFKENVETMKVKKKTVNAKIG